MKGIPIVLATCLVTIFVSPARAQTAVVLPPAPVPRPDIAGTVGWLNVNKSELTDSNDWYNRSAHGALIFGWYWSTHIKTELEVSASTKAELYAAREDFINGIRVLGPSEYDFSTRRVTLAAQYQFGENAWFHPHVATGVDVNREKIRRLDRDVFVYDPVARFSSLVHRSIRHPDAVDTHVRPFVGAGLKGYFTRRGFVRTDVRVVFAERVEEAIVRFGVGVDFRDGDPTMTRKLLALVTMLAVAGATTGCASIAAQRSRGGVLASAATDPALMASYVRQLPLGSRVRVSLSDGAVIHGTLIKADADPIVVQRRTRLPEAPLHIPLKRVTAVELEKGGGGPGRAIAIGAAAGAGAALGVLLVLAAIFSD
jgi:hypothetical protein